MNKGVRNYFKKIIKKGIDKRKKKDIMRNVK